MPSLLRSHRNPDISPAELTDEELIRAYVRSDNADHFGLLFERYTHLVFGLCMKYLKNEADAEDAVMSIFEKLMTDLKKHNVKNFKSWLYQVSKNHCLMFLRKRKLHDRAQGELKIEKQEEFMEMLHNVHHNNEPREVEGILISLHKALEKLRNEQRICIELMYLEKMTYREIADNTGFSMKQVKSFIQNGKRNLKMMMVAE